MPKTLEELKEANKLVEEESEKNLKEELEDDENLEEDEEKLEDEENLEDDEDNDDDKDKKPLADWMDPQDPSKKKEGKDFVPVGAHVEAKNKLRGRLEEKNEELEKLKKENTLLKQQSSIPKVIEKPKAENYTDQALFDQDMERWKDYDTTSRMQRINAGAEQQKKNQAAKQALEESVDAHYDRGATLVSESGIEPELFKQTDLKVRKTIENLRPGLGEVITDNLISTLGEGSEKVMYYLGVNETALNKLQALLINDPSGMKAAAYLGQEKQRLTTPKKKRSSAPKPSKRVEGDAKPSGSAKNLKRKYDAAHKKGDIQTAYKLKQQAKKDKVDTSGWLGE